MLRRGIKGGGNLFVTHSAAACVSVWFSDILSKNKTFSKTTEPICLFCSESHFNCHHSMIFFWKRKREKRPLFWGKLSYSFTVLCHYRIIKLQFVCVTGFEVISVLFSLSIVPFVHLLCHVLIKTCNNFRN